MGGNGTASVNGNIPADEQKYQSQAVFTDPEFGEIKIVEWTGTNQDKTPEESNSAPRIYATFSKDGSGLNEIASYGEDHKKEWALHMRPHNSKAAQKDGTAVNGPHIHIWENGKPVGKPQLLTSDDPRFGLLQRLINFYN